MQISFQCHSLSFAQLRHRDGATRTTQIDTNRMKLPGMWLFENKTIVKTMRLITILLFTALLQVHAETSGQSVSFSEKSISVKQLFAAMEEQTGYMFFFRQEDLANLKTLSVELTGVPLKEALAIVLKDLPLNFTMKGNTVFIKRRASQNLNNESGAGGFTLSPERVITGHITDAKGKSLAGVTITLKGTKAATTTDANGNFSMDVPENGQLEVTSVGFEAQLINIKGQTNFQITLVEKVTELNELVLVGYGSTRKRDLTGSVVTINTEETKNVPFTSIDQALAGKAPGVQVIQADGSPGSSTRIRIRGGASLLGNNDPLYVIDGVPVLVQKKYISSVAEIANPVETYYGESFNTIEGTYGRGLNSLSGLNPSDIESVVILKDASATAIYGSKGANGVIVITTKKGKQNTKPSLDVNYFIGFNKPIKTKVLNADQYKMIMKEAASNLLADQARVGRTPNATATAIVNDPEFFGKSDTDWLGMVLRNALTQNAEISLRGGGPGSRYYTSLSYTKQEGTIINSDFNRFAGKISLDNDISDKFRVNTNLDFGYTANNITNGVYSMALFAPPTESPFNEDGSYSDLGSINTAYQGYQNPAALATGINKAKTLNLIGSLTGEYDITSDLKFSSVVSLNYGTYNQLNYVPSYVKINSFYGSVSSNGGTGSQGQSQSVNSFFENTLAWTKDFNPNNRFNALIGTSWEKYTESSFSAAGAGFPDDNFLNNLSSAAIPVAVTGSNPSRQNSLLSFFVRANYTLKDKYLFTFTGRSDRSSKFAPANQVGYFPSGAIAWRISEENFLKDVAWIDEIKLRLSAGKTGTQNIADHIFRTLYTPVAYAGTNALIPTQLGNDKIKWESTLQKDIGLDYSFFGGKLHGTLGYYEKETEGLLLNLTTAPSSAFNNVILNIATIRNRGLEFDIRSDIVSKKNFQWEVAFNISRNVSKVLDIQGEAFSDPNDRDALNLGTSIVKEGEPLGLLYGRESEGLFRTQKELDDYLAGFAYGPIFAPYMNIGDQRFTLDPDGLGPGVAFYSNGIIGNASPDFYGGFTNTFRYKNLSLISLMTFSYGNDLIYQADVANGTVDNVANRGVDILDRYHPGNTTTNRPRLLFSSQFRPLSNDNVYDASYLKLKSIVLSYQIPTALANKAMMKQASFYVSATNLFTITSYPGIDPEVSDDPGSVIGGGRDISSYPTSRAFILGVRIGL